MVNLASIKDYIQGLNSKEIIRILYAYIIVFMLLVGFLLYRHFNAIVQAEQKTKLLNKIHSKVVSMAIKNIIQIIAGLIVLVILAIIGVSFQYIRIKAFAFLNFNGFSLTIDSLNFVNNSNACGRSLLMFSLLCAPKSNPSFSIFKKRILLLFFASCLSMIFSGLTC